MTRLFTLVAKAILSPEKIIKKIADATSSPESKSPVVENKFFIDSHGSVVLNRNNVDVQKAFADNVAGLSSKNKG
ncbi:MULTISPECIES: hypothetical protein [Pectobacterium]|uniref:Uncharacterized protein n=1 Tax=Pectobacterium parmentieri TaxID=1905730 RepID=A0A0H3IC10_PECPM|nr:MULTISPECIES: hypothetical protein [Pectobacterium]AFI92620.1 hypothetical protein W5S_4574 [Pectobacterium parmentieri]MBI0472226.1 hypothetical protein [Pectobacterium parmentieri]MBI0494821.1 hypothetical protein [Pectobacterium parmentieri]MBI0556162.1 hypothetical protein [Pectobacterium parmentieri]MBI0569236.1 hypothetical protein [Pectobacterium parmentieri]